MDEIKISNEKHYEEKNYMNLLISFHPLVCQLDEKCGLRNESNQIMDQNGVSWERWNLAKVYLWNLKKLDIGWNHY
jgi:hypothetical protein